MLSQGRQLIASTLNQRKPALQSGLSNIVDGWYLKRPSVVGEGGGKETGVEELQEAWNRPYADVQESSRDSGLDRSARRVHRPARCLSLSIRLVKARDSSNQGRVEITVCH